MKIPFKLLYSKKIYNYDKFVDLVAANCDFISLQSHLYCGTTTISTLLLLKYVGQIGYHHTFKQHHINNSFNNLALDMTKSITTTATPYHIWHITHIISSVANTIHTTPPLWSDVSFLYTMFPYLCPNTSQT